MTGSDVVVVGGGAIGLACAWRLAQRGARVTLLERGQAGREASWAAAGMLAAQIEAAKHPPQDASSGKAFFDLCLRSRALWSQFAEELGEDIGLRWGVSYVPTREDGVLPALLQGRTPDLRAEKREINGRSAAWLPDEGRVSNRRLLRVLERRAREAEVAICEGQTVRAAHLQQGRVSTIETESETFSCEALLWCAGAWSAKLEGLPPECLPPVRPVAGEMIALRLDEQLHREIKLAHVLYSSDVYLVPREVNEKRWVLVGATMEERGFDKSLHESSAQRLLRATRELVPALKAAPLTDHWAGLRPATPDGLPIIGRTPVENFWVATGHFRNGILLTPITAKLIADGLLNGAALPEAFGITRFAPARFAPALA